MKVLQVHLTDGQHKRLRVMSAERCVAMSELVRWWIDEKWGGCGKVSEVGVVDLHVGNVVMSGKTMPVEPSKKASEALKVMEGALDKVAPKKVVVSGTEEECLAKQKVCKHQYRGADEGGLVCWKCGYRVGGAV